MPPFHLVIHARPALVAAGPPRFLNGIAYETLAVPRDKQSEPLAVTFENALLALERLPRMFAEPDGAFVWVGNDDATGADWQVDGVLNDRGDRLVSIELKGCFREAAFDQLLACCGWPDVAVMVQFVREAEFLSEAETRRRLFPHQAESAS